MYRVKARSLLKFSTKRLMSDLVGEYRLVFDDGEVVSSAREIILSSYAWELHRRFSSTPMLKRHHLSSILKQGEYSADGHLRLIGNIYWDVYDAYRHIYPDPTQLTEVLNRMAYSITNEIYNAVVTNCEAHYGSLDILDFTAFTKAADVEAFLESVEPSESGIESAQNFIRKSLSEDPRFRNNPLAVAARTGIAREGQVLQMLGPRGFITDMDSHIFKYPVMSGHVKGIRSMYGSLIESRSASKSLGNSETPLKNAEFFSRRQQLICQNVRTLHFCDCGSKNYLDWPVRGERFHGITKISDGDLKTIVGKYYLDEETNELKVVKRTDTHLIGKTIKLRSPIAGCSIEDPYGICIVCYGEAGLGIPMKSNLGHTACVSMTAIIGQRLLSTKHYDGTSVVEGIVLSQNDKNYLRSELNGSRYYLSDKLKRKKNVFVRIPTSCAPGLTDLRHAAMVNKLNITRTSEFEKVAILTDDGRKQDWAVLDVAVNKRQASMTHEFLAYVKRKGYSIIENPASNKDNMYEFNMDEWNYDHPAFLLPLAHFNMSDHQGEIAKMLETTQDEMRRRSAVIQPTDMIIEFHDLTNRRLDVNLSVLEVVLYSSMVVNADDNNYGLPKSNTESNMGAMRKIMSSRSLSAQMAYQDHRKTFTDPASYVIKNRPDHIFDHVLMPQYYNDNLLDEA